MNHPVTGTPLGTASSNDNARKWNTRAVTVAGFKQPQPPSVTISGPTSLGYREVGFWNANVSGGAPPYTYAWRYRYNGAGSWSGVIDTDSQYSRTMLTQDFELKCTVTTSQGVNGEDTHYVNYELLKIAQIPGRFALKQNYPNPFNPTSEIKYELPEASYVTLTIFNAIGQKIRTLTNEWKDAGYYSIFWDGTDEFGNAAASGVYIYRIYAVPNNGESKPFEALRKMTFLK